MKKIIFIILLLASTVYCLNPTSVFQDNENIKVTRIGQGCEKIVYRVDILSNEKIVYTYKIAKLKPKYTTKKELDDKINNIIQEYNNVGFFNNTCVSKYYFSKDCLVFGEWVEGDIFFDVNNKNIKDSLLYFYVFLFFKYIKWDYNILFGYTPDEHRGNIIFCGEDKPKNKIFQLIDIDLTIRRDLHFTTFENMLSYLSFTFNFKKIENIKIIINAIIDSISNFDVLYRFKIISNIANSFENISRYIYPIKNIRQLKTSV